jgi:hypothetical protein
MYLALLYQYPKISTNIQMFFTLQGILSNATEFIEYASLYYVVSNLVCYDENMVCVDPVCYDY